MLISRGLAPGMAPETWNLEHPDRVLEVHEAYVAAGAEAVHTNTFGGSPLRLQAFGLADRCAEIQDAGVRLVRQAGARWVLGDIGPAGDYLAPVGQADPAAWRVSFATQARALAEAGVDGLHIETMSDLREATVALEAALEATGGALPVLVSMTFGRRRRGFFTVMGDRVGPALAALEAAGASAVGANCSVTSVDMGDLAAEALDAVDVPVLLQPNAGQPRLEGDSLHYDQAPEAFAAEVADFARCGVRGVGGCCGTDPRFIARLVQCL